MMLSAIRKLKIGLLLLLVVGSVNAEDLTGRQILDQAAERHEAPYQFEVQTMTLIDKKENKEIREVRHYARREADGQFKFLIVFHNPPGVKGVALLTWQHEGAEDDQWLYMPAFGEKTKRIAKGSKKNYFMGTDFTFEDLISESRDKFTFERKPDEKIDGVDYFVVEIIPSDPELIKETGYKSRIVWVRKDIFFVVRTDYFDKQGSLLKRQTASDLVNVSGPLWRGNTATMENFSNGHSTVIQVQNRIFDESAVPEENFQQRFILSGQHVR